ncbi:MAG: hypothetical protein WA581_07225, partial [Candidatus Acidiferrales bacterium]
NEHVRWEKALLRIGDEVRLKVVEAETVDKPRVRSGGRKTPSFGSWPRNLDGRFGNLADLSEPIPSAICMVLVIILVIERPASAKWRFPDKT